MDLRDFLSPAAVVAGVKASSKKQLIQLLAAAAAPIAGADERRIAEVVMERERLGTTGFGGGTAIPHGKLPELDHVVGLFAQLAAPIDYDALDGRPVDVAFLLLAPADAGADHLKALARVSRTFRDVALVDKLRGSTSPDALYAILVGVPASRAA